jgi:DNA-directed RNA polymerase subunit M/transcription elongation factor TFIIS
MSDIFENIIYCKNCNKEMEPANIEKNGFHLRILKCNKCKNQIIHPEDLKDYEDFQNLRKKNFRVKLRFIGNSYAISIPREIIDFMNEQEKKINEMVNLSLEEFGRISLNF